ncbi:MAG TPA: hypothetical protein VFQ54_00515, partial [Thermomicrobiales bacterium]|nr:hypothetical protein [Thermomicrobiales bacterium]
MTGHLTELDVRRIVRDETAELREFVGIDDPRAGELRETLAALPGELSAIVSEARLRELRSRVAADRERDALT